MEKGKIVTVTNENSPYFKSKAKIINVLETESVEAFLISEEIIVILKLNDICEKSKTYIPSSRKDFYQYIQENTTSRVNIVQTTKALLEKGLIRLGEGFSQEELILLLENEELDKSQVVEEFRYLRDLGKLEFLLKNNDFDPKKKPFSKKQ